MSKNNAVKNNSIRRIKYLVLMQIGDKVRGLKKGNKKSIAFKTFLSVLVTIAITAGLYFC